MRTPVILLACAALSFVAGTALFSPRVAVLVAGGCFLIAAALFVDVSAFTGRRTDE